MSGTLTLTLTKSGGKHQLAVDLKSPSDLMAHEHEADHAALVAALTGEAKGSLASSRAAGKPANPTEAQTPERESVSEGA